MRILGRPFIDYTDFHIPFTEFDEFSFVVEDDQFDRLKAHRTFDSGMQSLFESASDEKTLLDALRYTADEENAAFHTEFIIAADPGHTISGDEISSLLEERERTGTSSGVLSRKLKNVSVQAYVSPGPGVPEIASRQGGRKSRVGKPDQP